MFTVTYTRRNILTVALSLFIVTYILVNVLKPNFIYNNNILRDFGIGYRKKTVLPLWLISVILAIICYFLVLYYITIPRIKY